VTQFVVELGHGRTTTLAELLEGWARHVDRLWEEPSESGRNPDVWGAFAEVRPDESAWWWARIPKSGPAREELMRWRRRVSCYQPMD
jgi:hypothetical protein